MIGKRMFTTMLVVGAVSLGVACAQPGTSTPTQSETPTSTPTVGSADGGQPGGDTRPNVTGPGVVEAAGFTTFASPQQAFDSQQAGIWVGGSGRVVVTPDLALLSLGVEARAATVQQARNDAAGAMTQIMAVLTDSGIKDEDIRTQHFNIQPEYVWNDFEKRQEITGYRVTNTVSVKVRDLEGVGVLIDQVADAGGDLVRINSISFTIKHPEQFASQAREAAVMDAMAKARQFADLTGVTLGKLVYIAESGGSVPVVRGFSDTRMEMAPAAAAPPTPISLGEMDVTVVVQAVFSIG